MIKKWFGKKKPPRCEVCKKKRGTRDCIVKNQKICWQDCNLIRINLKCPSECSYYLKTDSMLNFKAKVDSQLEYEYLQKLLLDKWLINPDDILGGIPIEVSKQNPSKVKQRISSFSVNPLIDIEYLYGKLGFEKNKTIQSLNNPEHIAMEYISNIVKQNFDKLISMRVNNNLTSKQTNNLASRYKKNKLLKKIESFELISSAMNKTRDEILVLFEVNYCDNLCVLLKQVNDTFRVSCIFNAMPEFYAALPDMQKQVATMLAKNSPSDADKLIKGFLMMFFEDADLYYYKGILHTLRQEDKQAILSFDTAIELDAKFYEAIYSLAFVYHRKKDVSIAKKLYKEVLKLNKKHVNSLNNLAAIYEEESKISKAKEYWEKCLSINPDFEFAKKNIERLNKK